MTAQRGLTCSNQALGAILTQKQSSDGATALLMSWQTHPVGLAQPLHPHARLLHGCLIGHVDSMLSEHPTYGHQSSVLFLPPICDGFREVAKTLA